jgi:hypothetical protein
MLVQHLGGGVEVELDRATPTGQTRPYAAVSGQSRRRLRGGKYSRHRLYKSLVAVTTGYHSPLHQTPR